MTVPKVALGEVCGFVRGVSFDGKESIDVAKEGYVPILRAGNIGDDLYIHEDLVWVPEKRVSKEQYFQVGDIAICMASGSPKVLGKTAQLKESFTGSIGAFCGIIRPIKADPNYISYWLKSDGFMAWRDSQANGVNIQNLRPTEIREIEIPLPPLTEQKRIASLLARADRLRGLRRTAHDLSDALLQSVFLEMFGDPIANPNGWDKVVIEELVSDMRGGSPLEPEDFVDKGFPVLHKGAIKPWGEIELDPKKKTFTNDAFVQKYKRAVINREYVVVTLRDLVPSGPSIGLVSKLTSSPYPEYILAQGAYAFLVNKKKLNADYFNGTFKHYLI